MKKRKKRHQRRSFSQTKKTKKFDAVTIIGTYRQHHGGVFGFIDVIDENGEKTGYYVHRSKKKNVFDGDIVEAQLISYKGKQESEVVRVLERKNQIVAGTFSFVSGKKYALVHPRNPNFTTDILVEKEYFGGAKEGDLVGIQIIDWEKKIPRGKVLYVLGKQGNDPLVDALIVEAGWSLTFPQEVLDEAEKIHMPDIEKIGASRKDLRALYTFTIDGADSKDLDDAISIESKKGGGYILCVHIADVAYFVHAKNPLDTEAYRRGTSVYLVDRVLAMLPPRLSNNLCSLHPHTDKLSMTCEMHLDKNAKIESVKVYESIINSDARLTYQEVDKILALEGSGGVQGYGGNSEGNTGAWDNNQLLFGGKITPILKDTLKLAWDLQEKLWKQRKERGYLDFHFPETKIVLNEKGEVKAIERYPFYQSQKLIEIFMILANESVGKKFRDIPFLYRVHEEPKKEDIQKFQEILDLFHIPFKIQKGSNKEFARLLDFIQEHYPGDFFFLQKLILRLLSKAVYSPVNKGHFGLGLGFYSHFTSPIRRYPDLQIHRIIKEFIYLKSVKASGKFRTKEWKKQKEKMIAYYQKHLKKVGEHTTNQEIKAQELERKVRDYYIAKYYQKKIGEVFEGIISGMIPRGIFVTLKDSAEGFIPMKGKGSFNEQVLERRNAIGRRTLCIGSKVLVQLLDIDTLFYRLEFSLVKALEV